MIFPTQLKYPSILESEPALADQLKKILTQQGVSEEEQRIFLLVISEAFTNALVHGNRLDPQKSITVCLDINDQTLRADIIDQGERGLEKIMQHQMTEIEADSGRGINLMKHYVDDVQFEQTGDGGLKTSIILHRKASAITKC